MQEFRQFVIAFEWKKAKDIENIDIGFSPPKHGSIAAPWKMSTVRGFSIMNIKFVEWKVLQKEKYSTG